MLPEATWQQIEASKYRFHQPGYAVHGYVWQDTDPTTPSNNPVWCWEARTMFGTRLTDVHTQYDDRQIPYGVPFYGRATTYEGAKRIVEVLLAETNTYPKSYSQ